MCSGQLQQFMQTVACKKIGMCVGGCEMGRLRAIHTNCGVPQNGILTYILLTYLCTCLLTYLTPLLHIDTRQHTNFYEPSVNVTGYQKGVYYLGVKVFHMLPSYMKAKSDNPKKFKVALQTFLYKNFFYSLGEYFEHYKSLTFTYDLDRYMKVFGIACSFSSSTNLYYKSVCMQN